MDIHKGIVSGFQPPKIRFFSIFSAKQTILALSLHLEILLYSNYSLIHIIMKKLFFGLACIIGMMFFAGCTQEQIDDIMAQKPGVQFVSEEGYTSGNTGIYLGEGLNFKVKIAPNTGSMSPLAHFDFSITDLSGATVLNDNPTITNPANENIFEFPFTPEYASTYAVTATVTDEAGKTNVATVVVNCVEPIAEGLGTFTGMINIMGHITTNEVVGYTYDDEYNMENLVTTLTLGAVGEENRVSATLDIDGTPVTLYGTMDGSSITFDEFNFSKTITLGVDITLDLTMNITGTLENDELTLIGPAAGEGKTMIAILEFKASFNGDINGSLEKVAE